MCLFFMPVFREMLWKMTVKMGKGMGVGRKAGAGGACKALVSARACGVAWTGRSGAAATWV